jgi:hypothetical protein
MSGVLKHVKTTGNYSDIQSNSRILSGVVINSWKH